MHHLKQLKNLTQPRRISSFNSRPFSILDPTSFKVQNPYTFETVCDYKYKNEDEMNTIIKECYDSHKSWEKVPLEERIQVVKKAAEYFSKNEDTIARDITIQMGKPLKESLAELKGFHNLVRKLSEIAPEALQEKVIKENQQGLLKYTREPVGVAALFCPWNYPVLTCANMLITSVLAGNSVVVKHSPFTPIIGKHFEEAFKFAGVENIVRELMIVHTNAVKLYKLPEVGFVGFTGSTEVGKSVQDQLVDLRFIDYTLELGGNDSAYVAEDADVELAAKETMFGAFHNAGQSCNGIGRIYVHKSIYDDFLNKAIKYALTYQPGDPLKEGTTLGPLTLPDLPEDMKQKVEDAAIQGGRIVLGGLPTTDSEGRGRFFEPTIIADAQNDMNVIMLEVFGPIVGVSPTEGDEEAIKLINDNQYGLTSTIFSKDKDRILKIAPELSVGTVYGNRCLHIDPYLPWSGRKNSGIGTSLSVLGFHAVTNPKSYNVKFYV